MKHDQHEFLDDMLFFRLPINACGYIEDELLTLGQFVNEYELPGFSIEEEIETGRLQVLKKGKHILIARSDAQSWHNAYLHIFQKHLEIIKGTQHSASPKKTTKKERAK